MPKKYQRSVQRLRAHEQPEVKTRVKLYKANGRWLAALVFAIGMAVAVQGPTAQAASTPTATVQQTAQVKTPTQANTGNTTTQQTPRQGCQSKLHKRVLLQPLRLHKLYQLLRRQPLLQ